MDIKLEKKPWYVRYRYRIAAGIALTAGLVYVAVLASGPRKLRIDTESVQLAEVKDDEFLEYVDVEGVVHPILTLMVNTREAGNVDRIVAEEGSLLRRGDTILTLVNPDLIRDIEDQRDEWEKQRISYEEKALEMEQKTLTLKQQALEASYELNKISKSYALEEEEYKMGIRSKAQLEVSADEYRYKTESTRLKLQSLQSDSAMTVIRKELLRNDRERERKKWERSLQRRDNLVVCAPADGQLSFVKVTPGQQVSSGENIAEVKVMDQFKIRTALSEYYIDRVTTGLPASVTYQGKRYPLRVTKVVPEVKERTFDVDLVFTGEMPDNVRLGKSYRVQIELGQPEKAIVIPRGNFYQQTGGNWIFKLNADRTKAVKVPITISRQNPRQYEITEGLQPGDWVITTGYDNFGDAEELILR
ncbi:HlyD family efflux transporter periplasmic adaptor subunit [Bacteroides gallinaceum]|uniref:HlyD family efflux transporter periplasmic adaptor subunit n=1 Tax=Bacteroides gallinaceum TaxID=1462571 RepID=A0ABT7X6Z1_9BACE|nr:HlyD family efflux transporter periplasmic adaptor subunit [Bacteroides gallinaceum]MBM6720833.1 efflux RND transporter periplasmic adaptor subunit [Bacteroides gallinaceum]MDN0049853.1 HlyD family efflux transporter periplasmic adaptor subunit [Bacteroides gallinaceum]MDN0079837.1 HlyD family efflux transporter periplasmic adaptor subunit [Bacteroides gallinaceum]